VLSWTQSPLLTATRHTEDVMGLDDKVDNATEKLGGKAKEAVGKGTDDERLEQQGKNDQSRSDLKQAGEKVKDAFKR
jgi:uncharacterized protein YjbJ (UPF0337 family)